MKAESRQIPQKLAAKLKFVCCSFVLITHLYRMIVVRLNLGRLDQVGSFLTN